MGRRVVDGLVKPQVRWHGMGCLHLREVESTSLQVGVPGPLESGGACEMVCRAGYSTGSRAGRARGGAGHITTPQHDGTGTVPDLFSLCKGENRRTGGRT
jgi:hypothetical protein